MIGRRSLSLVHMLLWGRSCRGLVVGRLSRAPCIGLVLVRLRAARLCACLALVRAEIELLARSLVWKTVFDAIAGRPVLDGRLEI